jgi:mannose/cellobiose epimerase-like protein (N-acyl-D-glucosamine 2-epimerase family)
VLLAASSGVQAGAAGAEDLLAEVLEVIDRHFWDPEAEACVDTFTADWRMLEPGYRGQNANMHLVEAYMAAFEVTDNQDMVSRAVAIAERIINVEARAWDWRVPEHFDERWRVAPDYNADRPADAFRPFGSLVGHWFEWARLILQLAELAPEKMGWAAAAAQSLFARGISDGWDSVAAGLVYSVDFDGTAVNTHRMHWAHAEAVGAAVALARKVDDPVYELWYRRFWNYIAEYLIDPVGGSWWHELDRAGQPSTDTWAGKPDLYHALQATLYARCDLTTSLTVAARLGHLS